MYYHEYHKTLYMKISLAVVLSLGPKFCILFWHTQLKSNCLDQTNVHENLIFAALFPDMPVAKHLNVEDTDKMVQSPSINKYHSHIILNSALLSGPFKIAITIISSLIHNLYHSG